MAKGLGLIQATRRSGKETFHRDGIPLGFDLHDFWAWSVSDLVSNATRGRLAEYIVARGVGTSTAGVRNEWAAYDLVTPSGIKIEVKSAAYLQAWYQRQLSPIKFSVRRSRAWYPESNVQAKEATREADVYVFALLAHLDKQTLDPMNVAQWTFFVLPTATLDARRRSQRSITLKSLRGLTADLSLGELSGAVERAARGRSKNSPTGPAGAV